MKKDIFFPDWAMPETGRLGRCKTIILYFFFVFSAVFAQRQIPDSVMHSFIMRGIDKIMLQEYDKSRAIFDSLTIIYPNHPAGYIYRAANSITESVDLMIPFEENYIESNLDSAVIFARILLERDEESLWNNYFLFTAYSYWAYYNNLQGNFLSALDDAFEAFSFAKKCMEIEPGFQESVLAQGTFLYWKSSLSANFPFFEDRRAESIEILKRSAEKSVYNKYLGFISLIWAEINLKDFSSALNLVNNLLDKYPNNRNFLWAKYSVLMHTDEKSALSILSRIQGTLTAENVLNNCSLLVIKHKTAMILNDFKQYSEVLKICKEIERSIGANELSNCSERERYSKLMELKSEIEEKSGK